MLRWLFAGFFCLAAGLAGAQAVLPAPALTGHVIDSSGTLSSAQLQALEAKLAAFEASSGSQVVVLMVPTTQPEDIASYANRIANSWKIGRKGIGDGLLLIVAKNDRQSRIEVAKTLEGAIPDLAAKQVIDNAITPLFKQGNFAGGLDAGVDQIMALVKGEALPAPKARSRASANDDFQWTDLLVFIFFAVPVAGAIARRALGNKLGSVLTGGLVGAFVMLVTSSLLIAVAAAVAALLLSFITGFGRGVQSGASILGGIGRGGIWGGGFGGGGFSSGGGGNFGGGGASGSW